MAADSPDHDQSSTDPLLSTSAAPEEAHNESSIEDIVEPYLKGLTWRQVLNSMLGFLPSFFAAQQTFISIFTDAKPTWHCTDQFNTTTCNGASDICSLPEGSWAWDKPSYISIVSEWSLDCANSSIIQGLPASSFFMGCLLAGFALFFIGDAFGRKKMLFVSTLIMSAASLFTAFSSNVWIYSALRFLSGVGRAAVGTCALVLATESVERKWQSKIGSVGFVVFTAGFLLLPPIAYSVRDYSWRVMYFLISIPGIVFCILLQFFAYESPKWLISQGREEEAVAILKSVAAGSEAKRSNLAWKINGVGKKSNTKSKLFFFRLLMENRTLLGYFCNLLVITFGIGLVYYGTSLGVSSLGFNVYVAAVFNALFQVVSFLVVYFTVTKLKRRVSILALAIVSGVCCVLLASSVEEIKVGMELVAFFCASTTNPLVLIYTAELFPTSGRNSAVAMVWQALMLGGVVSPVLTAAAGSSSVVSYGVIGVSSIATGLLVLFLPETVGVVKHTSAAA